MTDEVRFSPEAERRLLGTILLYGLDDDTKARLHPFDFHEIHHRRIYSAMLELVAEGSEVTQDTVAYSLANCAEFNEVGGYAYLVGLLVEGGGVLKHEVNFVLDLSRERWAYQVAAKIAKAGKDPLELSGILDRASDTLSKRWSVGASTKRITFTVADLCAMPVPETRFAIPGRVPKGGLAALVGMWGDAKSMLAAQAALCYTRGLGIWGQPAVDVGNVLYLGHDMPQAMHQERFQDLCKGLEIDPPDKEFILDLSGLDIRSKDGALELRHIIEGEGSALLIVDSFASYFNGDENSASEVSSFTERLRDIGQVTDCTTLILHHPTKQEGGDLSTRARGSGAFMANLDAAYWIVGKGPVTARERTLQTVKFRQANPLPPQEISIVNPPQGGILVAFGEQREAATSFTLYQALAGEYIRLLQHAEAAMTRAQLEADARAAGLQFGKSTSTKAVQLLEQDPKVRLVSSSNGKLFSWLPD